MTTPWKLVRFGDVAEIASGLVDPREKPYSHSLHIGPENIESDTGNISDLKTAVDLNLVSGKFWFDADAIVYSKIRPNLNKVCLPGFSGICSADAYVITPRDGVIDHGYLLQVMRSPLFVEQAVAVSMRTGMPKINQQDLNRLVIPLPPIHIQKDIGAVVSVWDRGIRQLSDLIAAKVRFKQGLMQQLLTGKRRFKSFTGEWRTVHLKDVAEECEERNRGRMGTESVMAVTKAEGIVPMRERTIAADIDRYSVVKKNYFAYNPMRLNIGSISRWSGDTDVLVSPDYVVFHCKKPRGEAPAIDTDFLDQYRRSSLWERYVTKSGNGSVRVRIYFNDLGNMRLNLPSLPEQRKIAAILNSADREIHLLKKELDTLREQKRGLTQKLLTGQIRVGRKK
jgi:type I restriction enzyme S subunit